MKQNSLNLPQLDWFFLFLFFIFVMNAKSKIQVNWPEKKYENFDGANGKWAGANSLVSLYQIAGFFKIWYLLSQWVIYYCYYKGYKYNNEA